MSRCFELDSHVYKFVIFDYKKNLHFSHLTYDQQIGIALRGEQSACAKQTVRLDDESVAQQRDEAPVCNHIPSMDNQDEMHFV